MKTLTLFSVLCVPLFAAITLDAKSSEPHPHSALVEDLNKGHHHTAELKDMLDNINSDNAKKHGQAVVNSLYKISDLVDAADKQTCNVPEDGGPDDGDSILEAMDNYCDTFKDMIDTLGQLHHYFAKAGFEKSIRDALDRSQCSFQSFSNGIYDALPCRSDDIDDNVEDMNEKYTEVTNTYNDVKRRDDDDDDDDGGDDDDDDDDGGDDDDDDNGEDDDCDGENGDEDGGDDNDDGDDDHDGDGDDDEGDDDDE